MKKKIGFIGQGWVGKNYADNFEQRGFEVVRYSKEEPYVGNKEYIDECNIVFIAVPTPTMPSGIDDSAVQESVKLVGEGKVAVIKSTVLPGTTKKIQKENPNVFVLHAPEFLSEITAGHDVARPARNIVGIPIDSDAFREKGTTVLEVLPKAPFQIMCSSTEAELIKYAGNCFLYTKVIFINLLYDLSSSLGANFDSVQAGMVSDPRIGSSHTNPVHTSRNGGEAGRGAGGRCFIKDFTAFTRLYEKVMLNDAVGLDILKMLEMKNIELLKKSNKDLDLLKEVYGEDI